MSPSVADDLHDPLQRAEQMVQHLAAQFPEFWGTIYEKRVHRYLFSQCVKFCQIWRNKRFERTLSEEDMFQEVIEAIEKWRKKPMTAELTANHLLNAVKLVGKRRIFHIHKRVKGGPQVVGLDGPDEDVATTMPARVDEAFAELLRYPGLTEKHRELLTQVRRRLVSGDPAIGSINAALHAISRQTGENVEALRGRWRQLTLRLRETRKREVGGRRW